MHESDRISYKMKADLLDTFEEALLAALSGRKMTPGDAVELERRFRSLLWPKPERTVETRKFAVL